MLDPAPGRGRTVPAATMTGRRNSVTARLRAVFAPVGEGDGAVAAAPVVPIREVFARFWPYARPYRGWFGLTLVLIAVGAAIETTLIWIFKVVVDEVLV